MRKWSVCLAALIVSAVLLSGCSGAKAPAGANSTNQSAKLVEPEQLISKSEAAQLLGEAVKEGEKKEQPAVGQKLSFYAPLNDSTQTYVQIAVTQTAFMNNKNNTPESLYNSTKANINDSTKAMKVDGIGNEYFFGTAGLHILTDGYYLVIMTGNSNKPEIRTLMGEAAKIACKNLKNLIK